MKRALIASAVFAILCAPPVFAQSTNSESTVSRSADENGVTIKRTDRAVDADGNRVERSSSVEAKPDGDTRVKKSKKVTTSDGAEVEKSKTYSDNGTGKKVTSTTRKKTADGTEEKIHTERTTPEN